MWTRNKNFILLWQQFWNLRGVQIWKILVLYFWNFLRLPSIQLERPHTYHIAFLGCKVVNLPKRGICAAMTVLYKSKMCVLDSIKSNIVVSINCLLVFLYRSKMSTMFSFESLVAFSVKSIDSTVFFGSRTSFLISLKGAGVFTLSLVANVSFVSLCPNCTYRRGVFIASTPPLIGFGIYTYSASWGVFFMFLFRSLLRYSDIPLKFDAVICVSHRSPVCLLPCIKGLIIPFESHLTHLRDFKSAFMSHLPIPNTWNIVLSKPFCFPDRPWHDACNISRKNIFDRREPSCWMLRRFCGYMAFFERLNIFWKSTVRVLPRR